MVFHLRSPSVASAIVHGDGMGIDDRESITTEMNSTIDMQVDETSCVQHRKCSSEHEGLHTWIRLMLKTICIFTIWTEGCAAPRRALVLHAQEGDGGSHPGVCSSPQHCECVSISC